MRLYKEFVTLIFIKKICLVIMSKRKQTNRDENVIPRSPIGFNEQKRQTTSHRRAGYSWPQHIITHRYSENVFHIYSSNMIKTKDEDETRQRQDIPDLGQTQTMLRVGRTLASSQSSPFKLRPRCKTIVHN